MDLRQQYVMHTLNALISKVEASAVMQRDALEVMLAPLVCEESLVNELDKAVTQLALTEIKASMLRQLAAGWAKQHSPQEHMVKRAPGVKEAPPGE